MTKNRFYNIALFVFIFKTTLVSAQCPPTIDTQPNDATTCSGGNTSFTIVASETLTGVTAFSPWGVSSQSNLLPIELLKFEAHILNKNAAQLDWAITPHSTPKTFEVLKSIDGENFQSIATIQATNSLHYHFRNAEKIN
jgi:hypothetical protein